jgi:hypothetical protein
MTKKSNLRSSGSSAGTGDAIEAVDDLLAEYIHRALLAHEHEETTTDRRRSLARGTGGQPGIPGWIFGWLGRKELTVAVDSSDERRRLTDEGRRYLAEPECIEDLLGGNGGFIRRANERLAAFARKGDLVTQPDRPWVLKDAANWQDNLWEGIQGSKVLPPRRDRHTWAHHLRSSQAFALNLFVPLARSVQEPSFRWAADVWRPCFDRVAAVAFEYPAIGDPLNEAESGDHRTRVDVKIDFGNKQVALVEVKYTEPGFGGCSAYYSDENRARDVCRAPGWSTKHAQHCYLTAVKKRRYFRDPVPSCFGFPAIQDYAQEQAGCPFHGGLYQIMRNARMIDLAAPGAEFVVVAPLANPALKSSRSLYGKSTIGDFLTWAVPGTRTRFVDFERIVEVARNVSDARDWLGYMESKYLRAIEGAS